MLKISITPLSMISKDGLQNMLLEYECEKAVHLNFSVHNNSNVIISDTDVAFDSGKGYTYALMPVQKNDIDATAIFSDKNGNKITQKDFLWTKPLKRTFHIMISSHTDIGLHNSPYIQRQNCSAFIDDAKDICDKTGSDDDNNAYRYVVEGTWFWNNYGAIKGKNVAKDTVKNYVKTNRIGVCAGMAGNHIQTYGLEEMCRSTYERKKLETEWDIQSKTMTMIDNNGLPMSMIQPYSEAGYENIIFSPNQWNPLPSTIWNCDTSKHAFTWNNDASGGGARIDIRYSSNNPMLFWWENDNNNKLLVWSACQYENGSSAFGLYPNRTSSMKEIENSMGSILPLLDKKYPYDSWLLVCYSDDQKPDIALLESIKNWNEKWDYPKLRTLGNADPLFEHMREKYGNIIPTVKGDITGGWYQHPISTAELLADKFNADRLLPTAEKFSTLASMIDGSYKYPATDFNRAWHALIANDEHSYGTSGYQGRRVYETWMQHRDWIEKATETANSELHRATKYIASKISSNEETIVVFNPVNANRKELVETDDGCILLSVPALGYSTVKKSLLKKSNITVQKTNIPPIAENNFYKIVFAENGGIKCIYDKEINRELVDTDNRYLVNELVYTFDNHKTFVTPKSAEFQVASSNEKTVVKITCDFAQLGAEVVQTITIPNYEKRIDIENKILHAKDLMNNNRYYRYLYCAFPFNVENAKRFCHLNGCVAEYTKSVSGYSTDVYMATNEWCCSENGNYGVALVMHDSYLMEFDHIHPDKTDFGNAGDGSQMFAYLANDWLQMHCVGGSHLDYRFRYSIMSYKGNYAGAQIMTKAEKILNPVIKQQIGIQTGIFSNPSDSFIKSDKNIRIITLKPAEDKKGIICRFYGNDERSEQITIFDKKYSMEKNTVDERPCREHTSAGFITYRIGAKDIFINSQEPVAHKENNNIPARIGSIYTGLITKPCVARGENEGQLYLLWGANNEADLSHYKLYRGEKPNFKIDQTSFVANIYPEEYCVGRYVDTNLKHHTCYYYRVCAVNKDGVCSEISDEFSAYTKE